MKLEIGKIKNLNVSRFNWAYNRSKREASQQVSLSISLLEDEDGINREGLK